MLIPNMIIILVIMMHSDLFVSAGGDQDLFVINVTMKNYHSTKEDQIVFIQYKLPDEELTIVGYTPLVSTPTAHHMNAIACETSYSEEPFWTTGPGCGQGAYMLLYGWDRDALPFRLPEEGGIAVGKNTPYKYIIVNIHYLPIVKNDYSGNQFLMSRKGRKYLVGVVTGGAGLIYLPPKTHTIKTPFSCQHNGPNISIFAAAVHAHQWATVNSMYRVRDGKITLIVRGDPQQMHQSYLLPSPIKIVNGDYLVGQCVYNNDENRVIKMGLTHNDEMCNVLAGYLYERNNDQQINARVPLEYCWGNRFPNLTALIPSEKPSDTDQQSDDKNAATITSSSSDLLIYTNGKRIDFHRKALYISLIIVVIIGVTILLVVMIACLIRMKTSCELDCLNISSERKLCPMPNQGSIFSRWLNRGDGFERLEQFSDEDEFANNEV